MAPERGSRSAFSMPAESEDWSPFEAGKVRWLRQDDSVVAGIWACTVEEQPGIHEALFEMNETVYILEGRLRVEIVDGPTVELAPGDSASFIKGTIGRWDVKEDVVEFFVYSA